MGNYRYKIWCAAALLLLAQPMQAEVVDRIVAVVNGEVITLSELNRAFEPYRKRIEATYRGTDRERYLSESKRAFLRRLIDDSVIAQEARKAGIAVGDEEVAAAIKDILGRRNIPLGDFVKGLAEEGMSLEAYKKEIRLQMIRMRLIRREIKSRVMVTDEEIGEAYRKRREDYEGKEAVRIKQIFLACPSGASDEVKGRLRREAEEIIARLKSGEPFDSLAVKYSHGPTADGGDLGFIERGMVFPELEAVAFGLGHGEVSGIVESRTGFHIIKVLDKKGAGIKPIEEVREEIHNRIEEQKLEKKFEEWLDTLRKKSHIEMKL